MRGSAMSRHRAWTHQQPPLDQLRVTRLDLTDLEVLGHGQQVRRDDRLDRHGALLPSAASLAPELRKIAGAAPGPQCRNGGYGGRMDHLTVDGIHIEIVGPPVAVNQVAHEPQATG